MKQSVQIHGRTDGRRRDLWIARIGRTVSQVGDEVATVAVLLLIAPRGPGGVAAVMVVAALPFMVLGSRAGRLADRHDSRVLTVLTAATAAAGLLGMALATQAGAPLGVLLGLFAVVQCAEAVASPTWWALLPRIVGEENAARAAGTSQTSRYTAVLLGPALGGLAVGAVGVDGALAVDAASSGLLAVASAGITTRRRVAVEGPTCGSSAVVGDVHREAGGPAGVPTAGLRLVLAEPVLGPLLVVLTAFVVAGTAANVAEVLLVTQVLDGGPTAFGATGAVVGSGLVLGSLLSRRARTDRVRVVGVCAAALAMGALMVAEGLAPSLAVLFALLAANGVANGVLSSCFGQVLVTRSRDARRGQVGAAVNAVTQAAGVLGLPIGAALAVAAGPRGTFVAAGVTAVVLTLVTTASTGPRLARAVSGQDTSGTAPLLSPK